MPATFSAIRIVSNIAAYWKYVNSCDKFWWSIYVQLGPGLQNQYQKELSLLRIFSTLFDHDEEILIVNMLSNFYMVIRGEKYWKKWKIRKFFIFLDIKWGHILPHFLSRAHIKQFSVAYIWKSNFGRYPFLFIFVFLCAYV